MKLSYVYIAVLTFLATFGLHSFEKNYIIDGIHPSTQSILYALIAIIIFYITGFVKDDFRLLEISPEKKCRLGRYTWGDVDSPTYKYCTDPKNQAAINGMTCNAGFVGMPAHFQYTPESNSQWVNTRCADIGGEPVDPRPL